MVMEVARRKPFFVDNRDRNTLARAITSHLAAVRREGRIPAELCVASCYLNPQGPGLIAGEVPHVPRIRLVLDAKQTSTAMSEESSRPWLAQRESVQNRPLGRASTT